MVGGSLRVGEDRGCVPQNALSATGPTGPAGVLGGHGLRLGGEGGSQFLLPSVLPARLILDPRMVDLVPSPHPQPWLPSIDLGLSRRKLLIPCNRDQICHLYQTPL